MARDSQFGPDEIGQVADADAPEPLDIFLCYARSDGTPFVKDLAARLPAASRRFLPWYDVRDLRSYENFDETIESKIRRSDVMIIVLTRSLLGRDWCREEIAVAKESNTEIIVAKMHSDARTAYGFKRKSPLDFAADADTAFAKLVEDLHSLARPGAVAAAIEERIAAARDVSDPRHRSFIAESSERREQEQLRELRPSEARRRSKERIRASLLHEPEQAHPTTRLDQDVLHINEVPALARIEFRDRTSKLALIDEALNNPEIRAILVTGPGGNGKTALIGEVRRRITNGSFQARAAGFVYLRVGGYRRLSVGALLHDLSHLVPGEEARVGVRRRLNENLSWGVKLDSVLAALGTTPAVVAIDDVEGLFDRHGMLKDGELAGALLELVHRPGHGVRLVLTAGRPLPELVRAYADHLSECPLDGGLPAEDTKPFLQSLDTTEVLAFDLIDKADFHQLAVISGGNPRFLELVYSLLRSDPDLSVRQMLDDNFPHDVQTSVEEAMAKLLQHIVSRLDRNERRVVQALAVFGRPVRPEAVDFLLADYVAGIDSAPILRLFEERRLVRRDEDRYFLPPAPDVELVRRTIPSGDADWTGRVRPYSLPFLRRAAADYFGMAADRSETPAITLDDLQARFNQIDLLVAAGACRSALIIMENLDDEHLLRWGHSRIQIPWREAVRGKINDPHLEAHNLSYLVAARDQEEDHSGTAASRLAEAMRNLRRFRDADNRRRLRLQLAGVEFDNGRLATAARRYRALARHCRLTRMRFEEAWARISLGLCLARRGRFRTAERQLTRAHRLARRLDGGARVETLSMICLNRGWALGQLGEHERALEMLDEGLRLASADGQLMVQGRLLDGKAALLCDRGDAAAAVEIARQSAEIGVRNGHVKLTREANVTLALALLQTGDVLGAASAVEAAVRQPPGIHALGAWAVYGVVLFRLGDGARARNAFHTALTEALLRLQRCADEYLAHDAIGLALVGLELCGEQHRLPRALEHFGEARRLCPGAGARLRAATQLGLFGDKADGTVIAEARAAADGRR